MNAIGYARVSTAKQGESGLGLEGQAAALQKYADEQGYKLVDIVVETASGGRLDRPLFDRVLDRCNREKATLLIHGLDRAGRTRNILDHMEARGVKWVDIRNPYADEFVQGVQAVFNEEQRRAISRNTKRAIGAWEARNGKGWKSEDSNGYHLDMIRQDGIDTNVALADQWAERRRKVIQGLRAIGIWDYEEIAAELNRLGLTTRVRGKIPGKPYDKEKVYRLLCRLDLNAVRRPDASMV